MKELEKSLLIGFIVTILLFIIMALFNKLNIYNAGIIIFNIILMDGILTFYFKSDKKKKRS